MMSTSLFFYKLSVITEALFFGTMPPMCRGCPDVNKLRGMDTTILGQHWPFMSIKSFVQVHVATAGGWLTRYRPREVRNLIYRYRKIHIVYRSKFLYRFISPISIIYSNTIKHIALCFRPRIGVPEWEVAPRIVQFYSYMPDLRVGGCIPRNCSTNLRPANKT